MKRLFIIILIQLASWNSLVGQEFEDLSFGSEFTLEVMTWNIERFPKNGDTTLNYVVDIIEALDVDIVAIQEVDNLNYFNHLTSSLDSYDGYIESVFFAGLAYLYKPDIIQINNIYEIYTTAEYWNYFPRSPMVMDFNYKDERYIVINNHFKCCGNGILDLDNTRDEETRRYYANSLLKEYVETNFSNENVIILGDLNDILTDAAQNNVFQMFLDDRDNYLFADFDIATGPNSDWSYPSWPSHLDHILISNELFDELEDDNSDIQTIKIEDVLPGGWLAYDENISDHRPVALKLQVEGSLSVSDIDDTKPAFINYPNPFGSETNFDFNSKISPNKIDIYTIYGQKISSLKIIKGKTSIRWNSQGLSNGIYIAKLLSNSRVIATRKLVLME